jgi:aminoglycoside phosphotransferase (APT) family kinase protein
VALIEDRFEDTVRVVRGDGPRALAVVRTEGHHPADVEPTRRAIRAELDFDAFILECRRVDVQDGVVRRLLAVEAVGNPQQDARGIGASEVVDGREWTQPGWFGRAREWLERRASAGGWKIHAVEQIRSWEFSCVLRVQTDKGELYFKALPCAYASEVALIQQLATWHPAWLPFVEAADLRRRWVLLRACGGRCLEDGAPLADWQRVVRAYAELQVASATRLDKLRALGCRDRTPSVLRAAIGPLPADEAAFLVGQDNGLTSAELERLRSWQPWLEAACAELAASNLPLTLEHGDLWASNIYVSDAEPQFIDWTDACLSHPFLSLGPLLRSAGWDAHLADHADARKQIADAYLEAWSAFASPAQLRRALDLAEPLAALHIAVSYWSLTPQPHQQWWMPRGVPFFARMALELLPAAGVL